MGIFHFHLFFRNHKTDLNQTGQKCSLDGHIQDFCFGTDRKSNMAARANNVGGHLGWSFGSLDIILKVEHLRTIHAMFALNWLTGFRGFFLNIFRQ
jgi:hypothetical protein